jgi:hypothetical protein
MKRTLALLLITASFAAVAQNPPAITPESRDRFLNGVHDFAGGKTTPGAAQDPSPGGAPAGSNTSSTGGSNNASPASWRSQDGKVNGGSIVTTTVTPTNLSAQGIPKQTIAPQQIAPQKVTSPWAR